MPRKSCVSRSPGSSRWLRPEVPVNRSVPVCNGITKVPDEGAGDQASGQSIEQGAGAQRLEHSRVLGVANLHAVTARTASSFTK